MKYFARPEDKEQGIPAQLYEDHVLQVVENALFFAEQMLKDHSKKRTFRSIVRLAAELHDLGKLHTLCQEFLSGKPLEERTGASGKMLNHVDAGIAVSLDFFANSKNPAYLVAAILIHGHHIGFMNNRSSESMGRSTLEDNPNVLRDSKAMEKYLGHRHAQKHVPVCDYVDRTLEVMLHKHVELTKSLHPCLSLKQFTALDIRLLSSCLVAGDHGNVAQHMNKPSITKYSEQYPLRAKERRQLLESRLRARYGLIGENEDDPRLASRLRQFRAAKLTKLDQGFYAVTGAVGSGKTTASLELALREAEEHDLRRIFTFAPFNTLIDQTVETYRDFLILPDEYPGYYDDRIVAAHHSNNDYADQLVKSYNVSWTSPLVVTSTVQAFQTFASNVPSVVKKLHNITRSVIIIDEWHQCMPTALWGIASLWLHQLVNKWGCVVIYSSGTPVEYWNMPLLQDRMYGRLPQIAPKTTVSYPKADRQLRSLEKDRLDYQDLGVKTFHEMVEEIPNYPGPRLVVCNTVQNAAVLAHYLSMSRGRKSVEHLSTALAARDRKVIIARIKNRLEDSNDSDWTLVATSCIECGMDFSFRTGFAEQRSVNSCMQIGGRVNRKMEFACATLFHFILKGTLAEDLKTENPSFGVSSRILKSFIDEGVIISPDLCTLAANRELEETFNNESVSQKMMELVRAEESISMSEVRRLFRMIVLPSVPVLINGDIFKRFIEGYMDKPWDVQKEMQEDVVSIYTSKLDRPEYPFACLSDFVTHNLFETNRFWERFDPAEVRVWTGGYDKDFLGYMNGVLFNLGVQGVEQAPIPGFEWNNAVS